MRKPRHTVARKIVESSVGEEHDHVLNMVRLIQTAWGDEPFGKESDIRQKVCAAYLEESRECASKVSRWYYAAQHAVMPFLNSGEKMARADAQLDALAEIASQNMYDEKGQLRSDVMGACIKAITGKMGILTKVQSNLIAANKEKDDKGGGEAFDLAKADRDQLERFVAGELMDNPEIVDRILGESSPDGALEVSWHESIQAS